MVQRLLTVKDYHQSRRSLILSGFTDIPIVFLFLTIGILLWVFYQTHPDIYLPQAPNELFAYFVVHEMPVVLRGLIIAGVFATMMGSTSAALNALATSFTKDFYIPYFQKDKSEKHIIHVARVSTAIFGMLMIIVATTAAYFVLHNPSLTIIPMALGILGYCYGSLLGVFLLAILTKDRGNDRWNVFSMLCGMMGVLILGKINITISGCHINFGNLTPDSWPAISWPWFVLIGCIFTIGIGYWPKRKISSNEI